MKSRRSFKTLTVCMFALGIAQAAQMVVTVKGTVSGEDYLQVFGSDKNIAKGTPFTLVYTFDDNRGEFMAMRCPNSGSGISGIGQNSPGIAILTIGGASYVFGNEPNARSSAWRNVPTRCGPAAIGFQVSEGHQLGTAISVILHAPVLGRALTTDAYWRNPVSLSHFSLTDINTFTIMRDGSFGLTTRGDLRVASVTVGKPEVTPAGGR
jgi:hypothetical protein